MAGNWARFWVSFGGGGGKGSGCSTGLVLAWVIGFEVQCSGLNVRFAFRVLCTDDVVVYCRHVLDGERSHSRFSLGLIYW